MIWADTTVFLLLREQLFPVSTICHAVAALKHDSLLLVVDIMRAPPEDLYAAVRAHLLASHRLTNYQRAEKLVAMPARGARQPSQLWLPC